MVLTLTGSLPLQQGGGSGSGVLFLVWLVLVLVSIAGIWKTFEKAGEPGWAAIIPIYNTYVMLKIGGNAWWWLLLFLVPIVNIYAAYRLSKGIAEAFGQGLGFTLGLWFLGFVFFPILGFGDYRYQGPP
ncbi:hypothetical protein GCM10009037_19130 [Halarchaeum grantii]|uniref:Signal peptidase I n=1 Tax=Halarchaeum grantii TaxID=1193105 RepID=A0A830FAJ1_9EURY|nr:DUF5684 domain-containing protein [Halarchaeum grantii]GGL35623.1 hypothetical protein GCM10009037_19130 [Halarchaeum grantii]